MKGSPEKRFLAKVKKTDGCWEWTGCLSDTGYGTFYLAPTNRGAHQAAWTLFVGPIPPGMCVLHRCDNRKCVRPEHLFIGSKKDNSLDMAAKNRHHIPGLKGEDHGEAKLSNADVREIRARLAKGEKGSYLAEVFRVHPTLISMIKLGKHRT